MLRRALPLYAALAMVFLWPLVDVPTGLGILDWDQHLFLHAAFARSLFAFHQLPFWNPWYCGGNLLWQNPEVAVLSPTYVFALVVPLQLAMKMTVAVYYVAGLAGMDRLLRRGFDIGWLPLRVTLACTFVFCGGIALHVGVGHATFLNFLLMPFVLDAAIAAVRDRSAQAALPGGAVLAIMAWNGGVYPFLMLGLGLAVFAVVASAILRDWRPLALVGLIGVFGAAFAAPKLVPMAFAEADARLVEGRSNISAPDSMRLDEMVGTLTDPHRPEGWGSYWEYGNYVGLAAGALFLATFAVALTTRPSRDSWLLISLSASSIVLIALACGTFHDLAPATLLRHVPVYASLRKPSRYSLVFVLFAIAASAEVLRRRPVRPDDPARRRVIALAMLVATASVFWHNRAELDGAMSQPPADLRVDLTSRTPAPAFDAVTIGHDTSVAMMAGIRDNRDIIQCQFVQGPKIVALPSKPIVFADPGATASIASYSPNRIDVDVETTIAARVVLNQNYITGWRATRGTFSVDPATGLGSTILPAGFHGRVSFIYRAPGFIAGVLIFLAAVAGAWAGMRRKRAASMGATS